MENSRRNNISMIAVQSNDCSENENPSTKLRFSAAFRPIYYFSRFFGFMSFTFVHDSKGDIQRHKITAVDILWFFISLCIYLFALNITIVWHDLYMSTINSNFIMLASKTIFISEIVFCIIGMIMDLCNRCEIINILRNIEQFDKEVR